MFSITPSLPAHSFEELQALTELLAPHIPMLQVDIVDGIFVPSTSWPFRGDTDVSEELMKLGLLPKDLALELDCMVMHPEKYLEVFASLRVKSVIVHMRSTTEYELIIRHAGEHGYKVGLAMTNDIPLSELAPWISKVDFVQVMGIAVVGKQGQPFDERTLETLRSLHGTYPECPLVVDGAVNMDTIIALKEAGASRVAPGSAVAKASDPVLAYKQLLHVVGL